MSKTGYKVFQWAADMRRNPTPAEARARQLLVYRYGRDRFWVQRVFGRYIVDFWFPHENVVLEIDGSVHDSLEAQRYDFERDEYLRRNGLTVLRVRNAEVLYQPDAFLSKVHSALQGVPQTETVAAGKASPVFSSPGLVLFLIAVAVVLAYLINLSLR